MEEFKCNEEALAQGFCIFHDEKYLQDKENFEEHKQEVTKRLMDKVTNSTTHNEALFCIGYYLPFIEIEANFTKPVYFFNAIMQGANFRGAKFSAPASFNSAKFSGEADFSSDEFSTLAYFNSAKFSGEANFYSAKFSGEADFSSAEFSGLSGFSEAKFLGEANFNSAAFSGEAIFWSAAFSGVADFFEATFSGPVRFISATFSGGTHFYSAAFSGLADFSYAKFSGEKADFSSVTFSGEADFSSAAFSGEADFSGTSFQGQADFGSAAFSGLSGFSEAKFLGKETNFNSAAFSGEANFNSAAFSGEAIFSGTSFQGQADFGSAKFSGGARFDLVKFSGEADFGSAAFSKPVYFHSAKFSGGAHFYSAKFSGPVRFDSATFSGQIARFDSVKFSEVIFWSAAFSKPVYFNSAKFSGEAVFSEAIFSGKEAIFSSATFSGQIADFYKATFSGQADFQSAIFSGKEVNFKSATFYEQADFSNSNFRGITYFSWATFQKEANFYQAAFFDRTYFSDRSSDLGIFKGETRFNYVLFEAKEKIIFEVQDLSKVSFVNTDITRVLFSDKVTWGGKGKFKVIEEEILENSSEYCESLKYLLNLKDIIKEEGENREIHFYDNKNMLQIKLFKEKKENMAATVQSNNDNKEFTFIIKRNKNKKIEVYPSKLEFSLGGVMAVYRNLRENYEFRLRYDEAGKFFIREMELKRKYREVRPENYTSVIVKPNGWLRRNLSLTGLYYHLSRYGEDLLRPTLIGLAIVFGSTLFWLTQSNPYLAPTFFNSTNISGNNNITGNVTSFSKFIGFKNAGNLGQWQKAFERSFADFLPLLPIGSKIEVGLSDYIIKILGGALTFGFIAIALRRKFERKYTR